MNSYSLFILMLCSSLLYSQADGWQNISSPYSSFTSIVKLNEHNSLLVSAYSGIWKLDSPYEELSKIDTQMNGIYIRALTNINADIYAACDTGVYKSSNGGMNWVKTSLPDLSYLSIDEGLNSTIYAKAFPGGLYRSSDHGNSWQDITPSCSRNGKNIYRYSFLEINAEGMLIMTGDTSYYILSEDNGNTWHKQIVNNDESLIIERVLVNENQLLVNTKPDKYYSTLDGGKSWKRIKIPPGSHTIISNHFNGSLFLETAYPNQFFESTDNGQTWIRRITPYSIQSFVNISPDTIIAVSDVAFYGTCLMISKNGGIDWNNLAVHFTSAEHLKVGPDNNIYAATERCGLFRTSDLGKTWEAVFDGTFIDALTFSGESTAVISTSVNGPFIARNDFRIIEPAAMYELKDSNVTSLITTPGGIIYAGAYSETIRIPYSDGGYSLGDKGGGLWRSRDEGKSWERVFLDSTYKTTDNGKTWLEYSEYNKRYFASDHPDLTINSMNVTNDGKIYVHAKIGYRKRLFVSEDEGMTWQLVKKLVLYEHAETNRIKTSQGEIFAGLARSNDNGESFSDIINGLLNANIIKIIDVPNGDILAATTNGVYYLPYTGNKWFNVGLEGYSISDILISGDFVFASISGRLFDRDAILLRIPLSSLQETIPDKIIEKDLWEKIAKPVEKDLEIFYMDPSGNFWVADDDTTLCYSTDQGYSWNYCSMPDPYLNTLAAKRNGELYAGTYHGLYRSRTKGRTWKKINLPVMENDGDQPDVNTILIDSDTLMIIGTAEGGPFRNPCADTTKKVLSYFKPLGFDRIGRIYISYDGNITMKPTSIDLPTEPINLLKNYKGRIFASCSGSGLFFTDSIKVNWNACRGGLFEEGKVYICNFAADIDWTIYSMHENSKGTIYVTRGGHSVYASYDEGINWTLLPSPSHTIDKIISDTNDNLYITTSMGIFVSRDGGITWSSFSTGLTSRDITNIIAHPNGFLYAAASDGSIFRTAEKLRY